MEKERDVSLEERSGALSVVVVVDMVGYSSLARLLEENAGAAAVAQLNRQIQEFIEAGRAALPEGASLEKVAETGDGAILLFDSAECAHRFAKQLLTGANEHNESRTDESAKRWFRIGIASGEVTRRTLDHEEGGYAGVAIANAVRLEGAAQRGEIVADVATFEALPAPMRKLYGPESTARGKRTEVFRVHRYRVISGGGSAARWSARRGAAGRTRPILWAIAIAVICLLPVGGYLWLHRSKPLPFQTFQIRRITDTGDYVVAAVSPDGRYLLSALKDSGRQSLWLRNLPTNSNAQVIAPSGSSYASLAFSPDGNYIYFRRRVSASGDAYDLYRAPVLGGAPQLVVRNTETGASFSPDGKRIAFTRPADSGSGKLLLVTSNLDGTDAQTAEAGSLSFYPSFVAWSPDNRHIALATTGPGQGALDITVHDLLTSSSKSMAHFEELPIESMAWAPDASGLLVTYESSLGYVTRSQLGFIASPSGQFHAITNDTNDYGGTTLSSDGKTLSTVQRTTIHTFYQFPAEGFTGAPPAPAPAQSRDAPMFSWAPDGSIYFGTIGSLLQVSQDGAHKNTLLSDPASSFIHPSACPDGRSVVFIWSNHEGSRKINTWRVGTDGSNLKQLTFGPNDINAVCSGDSRWVYYDAINPIRLLRVPIDGGTPEEVAGTSGVVNTVRFKLSPDGRSVIFFRSGTGPASANGRIGWVPLDSGPHPVARFLDADRRSIQRVGFTPDGRAVVSVIRDNGTDNLWQQPIDGSEGHQITNFHGDLIEFFEFSPDGKTLGLIRTHEESDVVLLHDTGPRTR